MEYNIRLFKDELGVPQGKLPLRLVPFEEITPARLEAYQERLMNDSLVSPLGMYIKHEVGVRCKLCEFTTHEGYIYDGIGEVCFRCGVILTLRGFVNRVKNLVRENEDVACAMSSLLSFDQISLIGRDVERRRAERKAGKV